MADKTKIRVLKVGGDDVTVDECLEYMEQYSSIHLACHASQNTINPLQSRFVFHKGSLSLGSIIQRNVKNADVAFLSACETGTGEEKVSDEVVHLAAGMLAAGYCGVVATMWSIEDEHAIRVAEEFYRYLWDNAWGDEQGGFKGAESGRALHHTVQKLRLSLDSSDESLLACVPFVHFGFLIRSRWGERNCAPTIDSPRTCSDTFHRPGGFGTWSILDGRAPRSAIRKASSASQEQWRRRRAIRPEL